MVSRLFPTNLNPCTGLQSNIEMKIGHEADYSLLVSLFAGRLVKPSKKAKDRKIATYLTTDNILPTPHYLLLQFVPLYPYQLNFVP